MKEYLAAIVNPLLTEPKALDILEARDDLGVLLSLRVSSSDMGSLIGTDGVTAKSIRQLVRVFGAQKKARVSVRFLEPYGSSVTVASKPINPTITIKHHE